MSVKQIAVIIAFGTLFFVVSLAFVNYSAKKAQERVSEALKEVESLKSALLIAESENESLRESMAKYDDVMKAAITSIEKAYESHVERIDEIHNLPNDWLQCELPSGVQNIFSEYCDQNGRNEAAVGVSDSM